METAEKPRPWDRQPDESEPAYEAFVVFRDMGPERSILEAYRHVSGTREARQPSGQVKLWVKAHKWHERALAWDHHNSRVAQSAIDKVTADTAAKWAARRDARSESDWQIAEDLTKKVTVWARMPAIQRTPIGDGKTLVEPVGIKDTKDVAAIAQAASQMAWAAISAALPDADADFDYKNATTEELRAALERLEAKMGPRLARTGP